MTLQLSIMTRSTYAHLNINPVEDWHHVNCGITHIIHPSFHSTGLLAFLLSVIVPHCSFFSLPASHLLTVWKAEKWNLCYPLLISPVSYASPLAVHQYCCLSVATTSPGFVLTCNHSFLSLCAERDSKIWVPQDVVKGYLVFSGKVSSRCFPTTLCSWGHTAVHLLQLCGGAL